MRKKAIMETIQVCPECRAVWRDEKTCQDHFYQMLFWETENQGYGEVHHLTVLCYHLQHPSLYSPQGLSAALHLLADFLEPGLTPDTMRKRNRAVVDSGRRTWKIKGTADSHGAYNRPIQWTMTAANVIENGVDNYRDSVRAWANSIYEVLEASGNISGSSFFK
jgi:Family of unknown function (DUF5946)